MKSKNTKSVTSFFILIAFALFSFILFSFYTLSQIKNEKSSLFSSDAIESKDAEIGVVTLEGVIMEEESFLKKLHKAEEDKKIKAIIVRVNSPGGAVGPTQEIFEEIIRIDKDVKPVYASIGSVAASGGYYIASAARKIFSPAGSITGSIGVIMNFLDLSEVYKWAKVSPEIVKAGKYKDIGNSARKMTDEEKLMLKSMVSKVHDQFIKDILIQRKDKIKNGESGLREYAQGQIFSGEEAKDYGLVDEIAGLWQAGRAIHKELKLKKDFDLKFVKDKRRPSIRELLENTEEAIYGLRDLMITSKPMLLLWKQ